jgi:hypothetical protein
MNIKQLIGEIGEVAVQKYFDTIRSENWYDPVKDGMMGDQTYEVKTFRLNYKTKSFWLGQNRSKSMWDKVQNVDKLFFIKVPESETELATLYFCKDHKTCWFNTQRNDGTPIRAYPLSGCEEICKLDLNQSKELLNYSKELSTHARFV